VRDGRDGACFYEPPWAVAGSPRAPFTSSDVKGWQTAAAVKGVRSRRKDTFLFLSPNMGFG